MFLAYRTSSINKVPLFNNYVFETSVCLWSAVCVKILMTKTQCFGGI